MIIHYKGKMMKKLVILGSMLVLTIMISAKNCDQVANASIQYSENILKNVNSNTCGQNVYYMQKAYNKLADGLESCSTGYGPVKDGAKYIKKLQNVHEKLYQVEVRLQKKCHWKGTEFDY